MFRDSIDAFTFVLNKRGTVSSRPGSVSEVSVQIGYLKNGIRHCSVQITCNDGAGYGVDAFGDEAEVLYVVAKSYTAAAKVPCLVKQEEPVSVVGQTLVKHL
jgi:hypothetical protein